MTDKLHVFETRDIVVTWSKARCIHAAECVRGLPDVFEPGRRPWVLPAEGEPDSVARVILRCPTGALHFERRDGGANETPPDRNEVRVSRRGPLYVRGEIEITREDGSVILRDTRVALCRCGASRNKPFCDNQHLASGFRDPGDVFEGGLKADPPASPGRTLRIVATTNGPLEVRGPLELASADDRVRLEGNKVALCRCGQSRTKPCCDGSHRTVEFRTE